VIAVGVALVFGALVFLLLLRTALTDGVRASAERDAASIVQEIETSGLASLSDEGDDDELFQVVDESGRVLAASETAEGLGMLLAPGADDGGTVRIVDEDATFVLEPDDVDTDFGDNSVSGATSGELTVIAGRSTEEVSDTLGTVVPLVIAAVVLLLALLAATTWFVVGRALRPVDGMRREVDAVSATNLDRRVADPGSDDELGRLAQTMNRMLDRLDESQKSQRRFISDASHELKSPLASLRQYAEVARLYPDRVTAADLSDAVLDEGARLERLVQNMLVLAHADEHSLAVTRHPVDLDDLLLAEAARLRASTDVTIDSSGIGAGRVLGDSSLLAQVVRNLADNGARHATGRLALALSEAGTMVTLLIDDDGPGIDKADRERVFDRFVRLDDARAREAGGSGLGLAIVREIVVAHGGSVRLGDSSLGGARVEIRLPAAADPAQ